MTLLARFGVLLVHTSNLPLTASKARDITWMEFYYAESDLHAIEQAMDANPEDTLALTTFYVPKEANNA